MNDHYDYVYRFVGHDSGVTRDALELIANEGWELVTILEHSKNPISIWRRRFQSPAVQKIRDYVQALYNRHQGQPGCRTGEDACSNILHFIDHELRTDAT